MIHLAGPYLLASLLVGIGVYGILARRNLVLVLIGVELVLNGATVLLISTSASRGDLWSGGSVLTLFVITVAAAEVVLALGVILAAYRLRGSIDAAAGAEAGTATGDGAGSAAADEDRVSAR
ncbi:NADH-quinone oxidoreductase subunit K 2 [Nostocoides japonicum T1-X7]|uniref:NADH-quinone oxidoreductase subunit K n=1 Tax=Nostocoides japonicum T1-X7 TaxID=1194083 RepID=A0A077LUT6_9MICO|nr:NADH-quinone oxidoreductase subunit NuoK [Tetrasphaera japonica]CCH77356.1 NADH-quinone oxidoreductase subunit K 2 [Tetrasphaera japonica T1-X7]